MTDDPREPDAVLSLPSEGAGLVRRGLVRKLLALSPAAFAAACTVAVTLGHFGDWAGALASALAIAGAAAPLAAAAVWGAGTLGRRRPATLVVRDGALAVERGAGAARAIPLAAFASGWYVPETSRLELRLRNGDQVSAHVAPENAQRVLRAAGVDVTQRVATFPLRGMIGTPARVILGWAFTAIAAGVPCIALAQAFRAYEGAAFALWVAAQAFAVFATVRWFATPRLVVGGDGLTVRGGLRARFIPYSDVVAVRAHAPSFLQSFAGIVVQRRDGSSVSLPMIAGSAAEVSGAAARIHAAMAASAGAAATGAAALELIAPNGRPLAEWKRDLARWLLAPEGYRAVHLSRDELGAVLADAQAPPSRRLSAAVALSVLGGRDAVEKIRVAAEVSASEPVRVALEKLQRDELDDAALERALATEARR